MVREMLPHAETYVHEDDYTKQIACISVSWGHITRVCEIKSVNRHSMISDGAVSS